MCCLTKSTVVIGIAFVVVVVVVVAVLFFVVIVVCGFDIIVAVVDLAASCC